MSETDTTSTTDSTETASTSTDATQADAVATETAATKDWQAEAEKWKSFARKHEDAAKANADKAKRFDEFEESQKTELQKAADAAATAKADADAARAQAAVLQAMVDHGLSKDDLDLLGTHGTPEEINQRAERLAGRLKAVEDSKPKPDFGGGDRGTDVGTKGPQLAQSDLNRMTPEQIVEAKNSGQLDTLLGRK